MGVLIVLVVMSLYQVSKLWFDDISVEKFSYNNSSYIDNINEEAKEDIDSKQLIDPLNIAVYDNEKEHFSVISGDATNYSAYYKDLVLLYKEVMKQIVTQEQKDINKSIIKWDDMWSENAIFINITVPINLEILAEDLEVNLNNSNQNFNFDNIIIIPKGLIDIECYLLDTKQSMYQKYTVSNDELNSKIYDNISGLLGEKFPIYESSMSTDNSIFTKNILLPYSDVSPSYIKTIDMAIPYIDTENNFKEKEFRSYIEDFFPDNDPILINDSDEKWIFKNRDNTIEVNYNSKGILDYIDNTESTDMKYKTVAAAYKIAMEFITKDKRLSTEIDYYLADYKENGNEIILYFSYRYNGYNIMFKDNLIEEFGMEYPMEIKVKNGKVSEYKRQVFETKTNSYEPRKYNVNYINVLEKLDTEKNNITYIEDMYIGYVVSSFEEKVELQWIVEAKNEQYLLPLE